MNDAVVVIHTRNDDPVVQARRIFVLSTLYLLPWMKLVFLLNWVILLHCIMLFSTVPIVINTYQILRREDKGSSTVLQCLA
jgi:hypothetical protein